MINTPGTPTSPAPASGLHSHVRRPSGEPPPLPRQVDRVTVIWLGGLTGWVVIWSWVFLADAPGAWITERDLEVMRFVVDHRVAWLTPAVLDLNTAVLHLATPVVAWSVVIVALATRRIRHVLLLLLALGVVAGLANVVAVLIARPRPLGIDIIGEWEGFAQPSRPLAMLATASTAATLVLVPAGPKRRRMAACAAGVVLTGGSAQVYVGVEHPTDVAAGITLGVAVTLLIYRVWAPEGVFPITSRGGRTAHLDVSGARARAVRVGVEHQLGLKVEEMTPFGQEGSAGSTPLRIRLTDGTSVFAKLYARTHLRSDRFYKLGRSIRFGQLEDEHRFVSVRRLVQHEDHMLRLVRDAGIATAEPLGIVELTPEREYLLVMEFVEGAVEIGAVEITTDLVDQGLDIVARLWAAGLAHRDIKPANLIVREGALVVIDVAFAQVRPSPWRQAVDLANMMLVLALGSDPRLVHERAALRFSDVEMAEAFAAAGGVTIPAELRRALAKRGDDILGQFRELVPPRPRVAIQRWSVRRVALTAWVVIVVFLLAAALVGNLHDVGLAP